MNPGRRDLGAFGERVAVAHLEAKGYRIRARNFRCREGEIDIVAEDGDCLVFVEVRTRRGDAFGTPAESETAAKERRLLTVAQAYLQEHPDVPPNQRIDVVGVELSRDRLLAVQHIEGAIADRELA
ncbi:MAG: YraN family protein [Dehalococcoidia bacterium]|nr:MAG: YraN family protein [Dehalococcoidia bacterium]